MPKPMDRRFLTGQKTPIKPGTIHETFGIHAKAVGMSVQEFQARGESMTHFCRLPKLAELAEVAAFILPTGTVINLSCGAIVDQRN
jgi:hypothetical protein